MEPEIEKLLSEVDAYLATAGTVTETTLGRYAVNDGKCIGRLRNGKQATTRTVRRIREFMEKNPAKHVEAAE